MATLSLKLWDTFYADFGEYIQLIPAYQRIYKQFVNNDIGESSPNVLTYGAPGFPHVLLIEYSIATLVNTTFPISKRYLAWNSCPYIETDYYIEIDMHHPDFPKEIQVIIDFMINIIKNKCIYLRRHIFILKNVDAIHRNRSQAFRNIFEQFSSSVMFIATTNKAHLLEAPIKSRMTMFRIPLPTEEEQKAILHKVTKSPTIRYIDRNLVKNIFLNEPIVLKQKSKLSTLHYPPLQDFINRTYNQDEIRKFSFKLYQHNITIPTIAIDFLSFVPDANIPDFVRDAATLDHMCCQSDQSKMCFFIESILYIFYKYRQK
jgi:hypothetical protein